MLSLSSKSARAMEMQAFSLEERRAYPPVAVKRPDLQFFPTAEGFYDYQKDQYIYQYEDHLGNVRVSFTRNSAGATEITEVNDYYPFGMNHLKTGTVRIRIINIKDRNCKKLVFIRLSGGIICQILGGSLM